MAAKVKISTPSAPLRAGSSAKDAQGWGSRLDFDGRRGNPNGRWLWNPTLQKTKGGATGEEPKALGEDSDRAQ
jgi:hypothetical protein